jgi:hypothetical protein
VSSVGPENRVTPKVDGVEVALSGRWLKTARLANEWYEDVDNPTALMAGLKDAGYRADLLTFWQRLPHIEPRYNFHLEWDSIAALRVTTYQQWYKSQINNKTRNLIVKAQKKGVEVRPATFDDAFVQGMTAIFNETPIRQERAFLHYGKSADTVRREFSRFLHREDLFGAYIGDELIGFIFLANAGSFVYLGQIISFLKHRDKSPQNALIAKAVEYCAEKQIPHLVYALWPRGPLREFKRHNAFECVNVPRYYVPLTAKGALALRLGLHREVVEWLPENVVPVLKDLRAKFYSFRYRPKIEDPNPRSSNPQSPLV